MDKLKKVISVMKDTLSDPEQILIDNKLQKVIVTAQLGKSDKDGNLTDAEQVVYVGRGSGALQAFLDDIKANGTTMAAQKLLKAAIASKYGMDVSSL